MNNNSPSKNSLRDHVTTALHDYFSNLEGEPTTGIYRLVLAEVEAPLIEIVMKYAKQNQSKAAKWLGLNRITLRSLLTKYSIEKSL